MKITQLSAVFCKKFCTFATRLSFFMIFGFIIMAFRPTDCEVSGVFILRHFLAHFFSRMINYTKNKLNALKTQAKGQFSHSAKTSAPTLSQAWAHPSFHNIFALSQRLINDVDKNKIICKLKEYNYLLNLNLPCSLAFGGSLRYHRSSSANSSSERTMV